MRLKELDAEIQNASTELARGKSLFASGTIAKSRLDTLQTLSLIHISEPTRPY